MMRMLPVLFFFVFMNQFEIIKTEKSVEKCPVCLDTEYGEIYMKNRHNDEAFLKLVNGSEGYQCSEFQFTMKECEHSCIKSQFISIFLDRDTSKRIATMMACSTDMFRPSTVIHYPENINSFNDNGFYYIWTEFGFIQHITIKKSSEIELPVNQTKKILMMGLEIFSFGVIIVFTCYCITRLFILCYRCCTRDRTTEMLNSRDAFPKLGKKQQKQSAEGENNV